MTRKHQIIWAIILTICLIAIVYATSGYTERMTEINAHYEDIYGQELK